MGSNKNSFFNNYVFDTSLFVTALISLIVTMILTYVVCKHAKLKMFVTSIALQQIKETNAAHGQDMFNDVYSTCKIQWYTTAMLLLILLGIILLLPQRLEN